MKNFDVITQTLPARLDQAFDFIAQPHNLPLWAVAFKQADDNSAVIRAPGGADIEIGLTTRLNREFGIIDWIMAMPDGTIVSVLTRLSQHTDETCLYSFLYVLPNAPDQAQMQAAILAQTAEVENEFANLCQLLTQ